MLVMLPFVIEDFMFEDYGAIFSSSNVADRLHQPQRDTTILG